MDFRDYVTKPQEEEDDIQEEVDQYNPITHYVQVEEEVMSVFWKIKDYLIESGMEYILLNHLTLGELASLIVDPEELNYLKKHEDLADVYFL